jgi:hypothetical protein
MLKSGGMRRSLKTNTLVLISDRTKLYKDRWENGIFHYTGMGRKGDQRLSYDTFKFFKHVGNMLKNKEGRIML